MSYRQAVWLFVAAAAGVAAEDSFETGRKLQDQARYAEAEHYYGLAVKANPRSIPALTNLGVVLAKQGKYPDAIGVYKSALKLDSSIPAIKLNLAIAYFQIQNCAEAAQWFDQVLQSDPSDRRSRQLLAVCQLELGQFRDAVGSFERLMPSDDPSILLGTATAYLKVGQIVEGTALLDRIVKEHGEIPEVGVVVGIAQFGNKDYEAARTTLEKALTRDPSNADSRFYLGAVFYKEGAHDGAIKEWREAVKYNPHYFPALFALGALVGQRGEYDEANALLKKAVSMRPDHAGVHFELGRIALHQDKYPLALRQLQTAAKLDPQSKTTSFLLATTLQRLGKMDEARAEFARSRKLYKEDNPDVLANVLESSGKRQ